MITINNKTENLIKNHIKRLKKDIAEAQARIAKHGLSNTGMEATCSRDDAKKIALLREGIIPKYSDLPANYGFENNMPAIEMFEFADLMDETTAIMHDLDLIDWGKNYQKGLTEGE